MILLVLVGAVGCLALGWWQWTRFEAVGGTGQNLGYAFQWPLFAGFLVYSYRRFVQLEDARLRDTELDNAQLEDAQPEDTNPANRADAPTTPATLHEIPADLLPSRPTVVEYSDPDDPENQQISQYNQYLAELSARENDRSST
ncbi:transcriptional regulator [Rhodococcus sp. WMMA185]|nr:transcriptional regulator [Rhodococcus sp. WMMA185]